MSLGCPTGSSPWPPAISARRRPRSTTSRCGCRSEQRYREITSCSNYTDYSARRMSTRIKTDSGNELAHTLNGTACAIGRTLLFIMENHQTADGML